MKFILQGIKSENARLLCIIFHSPLCPVFLLQDKLVQAIKRIKQELDECREAERETYIDSLGVEVLLMHY